MYFVFEILIIPMGIKEKAPGTRCVTCRGGKKETEGVVYFSLHELCYKIKILLYVAVLEN